ncbi:hypothetical protein F5144DRAFT_599709 [Chaetomium tenue]|uniref:Uncharacterized protein n=1 Tax=Chaetomium tenue TaxID=1854479 RepID=A0ACB7PGH8_9PEZI|nr:hypothetical protein F5144DRAFT_599709 [Chaetomium globosum]
MVEVCFQHLGRWRKWLPFYGVVSVTEVLFQFDGRIGHDGRYFGLMTSVDIEKTKEDCQQATEMDPIYDSDSYTSRWSDEEAISASMLAQEPNERLRRIPLHYLFTTCARDPASANGLDTLSGMTHGSCIYPKS